MDVYYITGTSRGLGKALAEELLKEPNNLVIGLGRKSEISHPNYVHKHIDLSDMDQVRRFRFGEHIKANRVMLINNAGTLGPIKYAGDIPSVELIAAINVNLVSPAVLTNDFIKDYKDLQKDKVILNISSGAAVNPYDGWSLYCTSKAGLNMYTQVIKKECAIRKDPYLKILAVAPGILETDMQAQIRESSEHDFSMIGKFKGLKESGELRNPAEVAIELLGIAANINDDTPSFIDVRDNQ